MELITNDCGTPCNQLQLQADDLYVLQNFLKGLGVKINLTGVGCGANGKCVIEGENLWKSASAMCGNFSREKEYVSVQFNAVFNPA